jgi:hypothetical protein
MGIFLNHTITSICKEGMLPWRNMGSKPAPRPMITALT